MLVEPPNPHYKREDASYAYFHSGSDRPHFRCHRRLFFITEPQLSRSDRIRRLSRPRFHPGSVSLAAGQTARAHRKPQRRKWGRPERPPCSWFTSSASIASVSDSGVISAVAPGTALVSAVSEGVSGQASMAVTPPPPTPIATVIVTLSPSAVVAGQTAHATATLEDSSGNPIANRVVTWESSNTAVATVDPVGTVQAIASGNAMIKASSEGKSNFSTLSVSAPAPIPVALVSVTPSSAGLQVGATMQLSAATRDANSNVLTGRVIGWSSGNGAIATVSPSGLVTAIGAGSVSITAASEGQTGSATITVSAPAPIPVASVSVTPSSASLQVNATVQLSAATRDANNNVLTGRVIGWSSGNGAIATVSSSGLVTAKGAGSISITAASEGQTGSATITVSAPAAPAPVATVSVAPVSSNVLVGATVQLSATTRDASGNLLTGRVVSWSSPNGAIASVNPSTGLVTGVTVGSLTITATSEGKTGSATINVQAPPPPPPPGSSNEPAGMTRIDDRPFNSLAEHAAPFAPAWDTDNSLSIISDNTAPISAPNVLRVTYPAGFPAGSAPGHAGTLHTAYKTVYIRFAAKLSANWVGNGSGTNKYLYEWIVTPNKPAFFFSAEGAGNAPLHPWARLQDIVVFPGGSGNLSPNLVPSAEIIRGRWHTFEIILTGNSAGTADGIIDWYLDGVHVGHVAGIQWTPAATTFNTFELRPIWGGIDAAPAITQDQTMDWDDVYLSGKN